MLFWIIVVIMIILNILTLPYTKEEIEHKRKVLIDDAYRRRFDRDE